MCSCAPLPHPPAPPPNLNPKPNAISAHGPTPLRRALVARAAARDDAPAPAPSSFDFLALKRELEEQEEAVLAVDARAGEGGDGAANEEDGEREAKRIGSGGRRTRRQMARRSGLLAKQVISVSSARSLGFVSQLWVDPASVRMLQEAKKWTTPVRNASTEKDSESDFGLGCLTKLHHLASPWVVTLVEVRPSLLSGEAEKFLFEDIYQVGDVVLVENESVVENEFKLVGLHGLVGYNVVTSRRRSVGKVRGFTFNINSGVVESLELDSFGLTIVPASLVSTYCLFVEDVLDIVSDTIVVHEDAVSRVQRLTQGIWGTQNIQGPGDQMGEYSRYGRRRARPVKRQNSQQKSVGRKLDRRTKDLENEWELPMEY
uniref:Uncharacterized protein n=1 Tax=Avena sativa TaxID=4498 RepID=A0ACD5YLX2_AVESA